MLTLYRQADCPVCDEVAGELREKRLAHKVVQLDAAAPRPEAIPADCELPVLWDDGASYSGSEAIAQYLAKIAAIKDRWQQHGSDACFCDPDGEIL